MIKLRNLLPETPIDTFQTIGDFSKNSSFKDKTDRALVTHPVAVQKIKDFFKNTGVDFDFYFVNTKHAKPHVELGEVQEEFIFDKLKVTPDQLRNGKISEDNITIFFTGNSGDEKVPFTAWIIAHRIGHVMRRVRDWKEINTLIDSSLKSILSVYGITEKRSYDSFTNSDYKVYEQAKRLLCEALGTFKSARDGNLRNSNEFTYELFAQYLKNGSIELNDIPEILTLGYRAYGRKEVRRVKDKLLAEQYKQKLEAYFPSYAEVVLEDCRGKIFLM
jgi:hypothetical protein